MTWFEKGFEAAGGKVVQKLLPRLGTPDFGSYIAQIDDSADVGLVFMAGGDAVRFIKQFADYGKKLPLYGFTATVDEAILPAQGKAALGFVGASRSQQGAAGTCWHSGGPASCNLLRQQFIVENRPGGGIIGTKQFLAQPADGYTIGMTSLSTLSLVPIINSNAGYDPLCVPKTSSV